MIAAKMLGELVHGIGIFASRELKPVRVAIYRLAGCLSLFALQRLLETCAENAGKLLTFRGNT